MVSMCVGKDIVSLQQVGRPEGSTELQQPGRALEKRLKKEVQ